MRVGPLDGLLTSRSTGPITLTVTFSIGRPVPSVMKSIAVVVAEPDGRGRGACVTGAGVVTGGLAGGCAGA
jgi:hypothetical protein